MSDRPQTYPDTPSEIYASEANYIRLDVKVTLAGRLVGWLREYAKYCDIAGASTTAGHARHLANRLASQLDGEDVITDDGDTDD